MKIPPPTKMTPLYRVNAPTGIETAIGEVLRSGELAGGSNVELFESRFGSFIGNPLVTSTGEVSSTIAMCLYMAGVRPGDEVIASPLACLATNIPILNLFANVKWCDVDPLTGNMDAADLAAKISKRTKAILLFHWAGNPADLKAIYKVAKEREVPILEDASEALGAEFGGRRIGNTGADYVVYSFYPNRHLTTIDGAAVAFGDEEQFERGRWLKRYGIHRPSFRDSDGEINPESNIIEGGWSSYLNHVAATVGVAQIESLPDRLTMHQENGECFDAELKSIPNVTVLDRPDNSRSAYWVYTFLSDRRDSLLTHLKSNGVQASKVHLRNDVYSCFGGPSETLPGVDDFSRRGLSIPCGWWVDAAERERIVEVIASLK
ncbi:MAG: DegT/DnrJ/EryC1/StrS family aminotransferase [Pirellulaceae bacterium]